MTGIEPVPFSWLFVGLLISWRLPKSHTCATLCYTVFTRPKRNMAAFLLGLHFHIRETHDLFLRDGTKYVRRSGWKIFKEVKLDARFRWILSACYYCYYSMLNILRLTPAETRYVRFTHRIRFDSTTFSGTISRFGTSLALKVWRRGIQTQQLCNWTMIQSAATNPPWTNPTSAAHVFLSDGFRLICCSNYHQSCCWTWSQAPRTNIISNWSTLQHITSWNVETKTCAHWLTIGRGCQSLSNRACSGL